MDPQALARIHIWASCDPTSMPRAELLELIAAAGLAGTAIDAQVRAMAEGLATVDRATVLELVRRVEGLRR